MRKNILSDLILIPREQTRWQGDSASLHVEDVLHHAFDSGSSHNFHIFHSVTNITNPFQAMCISHTTAFPSPLPLI